MSDITLIAEPSPFMRVNEPATVQDRYDGLENYFPIYKLPGRHFKPDAGSFYDRMLHPGSRVYCDDNGPSITQSGIHIGLTAIVFEVEGRVCPDYCFLSSDGDQEHPINVDDEAYRCAPARFASCWLEAPNDSVEGQGNWHRALLQLERIARHTDSGVHMGEFIAPKDCEGREGSGTSNLSPAYLQVSWTAPPGFDNLDVLPVFDAKHGHIAIPSRAQMPVHKRVRVRFVLHLGPIVPGLGGPIVAVNFVFMHILD
ncbi:hypothetical protein EWM64_g8751 [Hericium alpestre]|uniref:Uncharacterized protein n=1 Tax=Hericium alpestre TaxID=135208 RepID=A0A4Y9ZMR1_9AGAM|nr:hypothetical protein EWM64_g8751 [Hericium alpestre]